MLAAQAVTNIVFRRRYELDGGLNPTNPTPVMISEVLEQEARQAFGNYCSSGPGP